MNQPNNNPGELIYEKTRVIPFMDRRFDYDYWSGDLSYFKFTEGTG
jgi:hypothetical protein